MSSSLTEWLQPFQFLHLRLALTDKVTVDIVGGGQLGRMMIEAGNRIGVRIAILDPGIVRHCEHHRNTEYHLLHSLDGSQLNFVIDRRIIFACWSTLQLVHWGKFQRCWKDQVWHQSALLTTSSGLEIARKLFTIPIESHLRQFLKNCLLWWSF